MDGKCYSTDSLWHDLFMRQNTLSKKGRRVENEQQWSDRVHLLATICFIKKKKESYTK